MQYALPSEEALHAKAYSEQFRQIPYYVANTPQDQQPNHDASKEIMNSPDPFRVLKLSDAAGKDFLRGLLLTGRCIPFIGAGFTAGDAAYKGTVPSGAEFLSVMRSAITNK